MSSPLRTAATHTLDEKTARALWNWLLRRQGLADDTRFHDVEPIAHAALGLHAARLPSPYATVAARSTGPDAAAALLTDGSRQQLLTVRCMRKTLHALPLDLAAAAHAATRHYRERDALRAVVNAGERSQDVENACDDLARLLDEHGPLQHRDIEQRLAQQGIPTVRARLAVKLCWERGTTAYLNTSQAWNREVRTFALTKHAYPTADFDQDRTAATTTLIEAYFDRYGPASLKDAMWWSALSRAAITTALNACQRDLVTVTTPWSDQPQYMFADRLAQFHATDHSQHTTGVNLLAHEDVALKAYFDTRTRYLADLPARRAFNQIGEALPTIAHDGHVIGTWAWDEATRRVTTSTVRDRADAAVRRLIRARADQLTHTLRRCWTSGQPTRTATIPGQTQLLLTSS
ncbi:DNA glycosylase AlkZ-like family protein [Streptomyces sp. NPDC058659]|uniref:DNA glycosylase AlkZ-like family protein n=1 Tax=Streptomyces sp. NPDC058659 TaxID=3346581 RepID=UPI003660099E